MYQGMFLGGSDYQGQSNILIAVTSGNAEPVYVLLVTIYIIIIVVATLFTSSVHFVWEVVSSSCPFVRGNGLVSAV